MSDEHNHQNFIVGAAVVAGVLGALSALMHSNRSVQGWTEQAKDTANQMIEKGEVMNKNMLLGGVAGGLIGAATALLLAPKSGLDLMKDLTHPFSEQGGHKRSSSRSKSSSSKSSSRRTSSRGKGSARSTKSRTTHHGAGKSEENKSHHKSSTKKKSSNRRRTATAALKQAASAPEKALNEITQAS